MDTVLLRLACNKQDFEVYGYYFNVSNNVVILDIRSQTTPVAELERRQASVNVVAWAPKSGQRISSAGEDAQALIWELPNCRGINTTAQPGVDWYCIRQ